jgi:fucose permease
MLENTVRKSTTAGVVVAKPTYFFLERYMPAYAAEWAAFVEAVTEGKPLPVTLGDGVAALAAATIGAATLALGSGVSWKVSCLVLAVLPFSVGLAFAALRFPVLVAEGQRVRLRSLIRRRWFVLATFAIFLGAATELALAQWLAGYAELALEFSRSTSGWALFVFSVFMAVGRMIIGALGNRVDGFNLMLWSSCASVLLFLGGAFLPDPEWALGACVIAGFTVCCFWPTMLAVSANEYPMAGASMYGGLAIVGNIGGILMPWLIGWVGDIGDLHWGLGVAALAPLLMIPTVLALRSGRPGAVRVVAG